MLDPKVIQQEISDLGFELALDEEPSSKRRDRVFGSIRQKDWPEGAIRLLASAATYTFSLLLGDLDEASPSARYGLLLDLFELNFQRKTGHIALLRIPTDVGTEPVLPILLAETTFFRRGLTAELFAQHVRWFRELANGAADLLGTKGVKILSPLLLNRTREPASASP